MSEPTHQQSQVPNCQSYCSHTEDPFRGYRRIWAKALLRSIEDLHSKSPLIRKNAKAYFKSRIDNGPGSLQWICGILGYEVETVRRYALEMGKPDRTRWGDPCKKDPLHIMEGKTKRYCATEICVLCQAVNNKFYKARAKNGG